MTERRYGLTPLTLEQIESGFDSAFAARDLASHIRELQARVQELEGLVEGLSNGQLSLHECLSEAEADEDRLTARVQELETELTLARKVAELEADDANSLRKLLGADDGINEPKGE